MDLFDWPITKTSDQTLGTPKMDIFYSSLLDHLCIGYTRVELGGKEYEIKFHAIWDTLGTPKSKKSNRAP
jgi:hypothetical protein